jgi:L-ascorbate metabolism protein UlaG (beta-lactamase superfamily)
MAEKSVMLKWFPPSWFQIRACDQVLYIDPAYLRWYFSDSLKKIEFSRWPDEIDGLPEELDEGDIVLITHKHKDHCKHVTVDRLKGEGTIVVAPKACRKELGPDYMVVKPGDTLTRGGASIKAVDAYNTEQGNSTKKVHHRGDGVGYLVRIGDKTIYHAGDTDLIPEMRELGDIDVALLPIGGIFTMDIDEAVEAALAISPKVAIPMHNGKEDRNEFKRRLEARSNITTVAPEMGEDYMLK